MEGGETTGDLALLAGPPNRDRLGATGFLDAVERNLKRALGA